LSLSARFIAAFPRDSTLFKIPSLSRSISKLSIIKSPSKSSGQKLTGISTDSNVAPVQFTIPINLYLPGSESIGL